MEKKKNEDDKDDDDDHGCVTWFDFHKVTLEFDLNSWIGLVMLNDDCADSIVDDDEYECQRLNRPEVKVDRKS